MTFKELFDLYLECHLQKSHAMLCRSRNRVHQKPDIARWQSDLKNRISGSTANRARQVLRAVFNWAIRIEAIPDYNPAARIGRFKENERDRFLSEDEIITFQKSVNQLHNRTAADFFLMLLYTSARKTNVLCMRWDEIDPDRAIWTIPVTKNGDSL